MMFTAGASCFLVGREAAVGSGNLASCATRFADFASKQRCGKLARLTLLRDGRECLQTGPDILQRL